MRLGELITWVAVVGFGIWAFCRMRNAMRGDHEWSSQLLEFAKHKALIAHEVDGGPGVFEPATKITWKLVKRWWSRNPSMDRPPTGSTIFEGKSNGLSISMDTVLIRKYWTNLYDEYLRVAVELPEMPRSLIIYPTGRIRRVARLIGIQRARGGAIHPGNITAVLSSNPIDRGKEQSFLSLNRLRILAEFEEKLGGVYVYEGKVFLIKRRKGTNPSILNAVYDNIILLAKRLAAGR